MDKKICSECGVANESEYIYCKNCGAPLTKPAVQEEPEFIGNGAQNTADSQSGFGEDPGQGAYGGYNPPYGAPNFAGAQ